MFWPSEKKPKPTSFFGCFQMQLNHMVFCNHYRCMLFSAIASYGININLDELDHSTRAKTRVRTFPPCYHLGSGLFGCGHLSNHCIYTSQKSVRRESYLPDEHKFLAHVCKKKITRSHLPYEHPKGPDIGLGGADTLKKAFWAHPQHWQPGLTHL